MNIVCGGEGGGGGGEKNTTRSQAVHNCVHKLPKVLFLSADKK